MKKPVIDAATFQTRVKKLISVWKNTPESFNGAGSLLVITDAPNENIQYSKSSSLQTWLLGYEFPKTILLFSQEKLLVVTSNSKAKMFEELKSSEPGFSVEIASFGKEEDETKKSLKEAVKFLEDFKEKPVGVFQKDKLSGKFISLWNEQKKDSGLKYEEVDFSLGLALTLASKDQNEQKLMKLAAKASSQIMKNFFVEEMTSIIDAEKKVTHEALSDKLEGVIFKEKDLKKAKIPSELEPDQIDWSYTPIIQSGGDFDLKPSALSSSKNLSSGVILCSLGIRYNSYCSNIGRTFLIDSSPEQEKNYAFLLELQKHVISQIKAEGVFSDIYKMAVEFIKDKRPELEECFTKNCGFLTGIEFRESNMVLNIKNSQSLSEGMVLCLSMGFQNLVDTSITNKKLQNYSIQLIDTIRVDKTESVILTNVLRETSDITYFLNNDNDNEVKPKKENGNGSKSKPESQPKKVPANSAILKSKFRSEDQEETPEQKRIEHQRELFVAKQEEGLRRFKGDGDTYKDKKAETFKYFESYKRETGFPKEANRLNIIVDQRAETIIVPINGLAVPFHISTLKNVSKNDEGGFVYLRLNFLTPGQGVAKKEELPFEDPNAHFLRALTFRSTDTFRLTEIYKKILDLKKDVAKKEIQKKDMAELVQQDKLKLTDGRVSRLPDIFVRPQPEGKRMPGELEIHVNGLRYKHPRGNQNIDVLFSNVRHIFFQPCENELLVLIHVHLVDPIMIGKKKTKDIQFYREASDVQFDETGNRRRGQMYGDDDELEAEREERRRIKELNDEFKNFASKISDATRRKIEVDIPFREIGFSGVPFRSNVFLMPTTECLVHLSDPPFLVITLSEVEIVHMERVQFGLKNFDMVFIFKDFAKVPVHINTIPMKQLEAVKEWLDSVDVVFTEGPVNLNWGAIMKTIRDDPVAFYEDNGWGFLDSKDENSEASEESASEFEIDSEEFNASSESEYESEEAAGSDDYEEDATDESEEGEDWDKLEEKARREDTQKRGPDDIETFKVSKKRR